VESGGDDARRRGDLSAALRAAGLWLLAPVCVLCGASAGENLCGACAAALPYLEDACPRCASPADHGSECWRCRDRPPPFAGAVCALRYEAPVPWLIHRLKFAGDLAAGHALGEVLGHRLAGNASGAGAIGGIVPVPLHAARLRARGFNQARLIAECVSRRLGVPLLARAARRTRETGAQARLSPAAREGNVRGAFSVTSAVAGRRVALVDDVLTSGATVRALADAVLAAGAASVVVWGCARSTGAHASRLATDKAFASMNSLRGST